MAEDRRERRAKQAVAAGKVGVADADAADAHQHVARSEVRQIDLFEFEARAGGAADRGDGFHEGPAAWATRYFA